MRGILQRLWALPWPNRVRRGFAWIIALQCVHDALFPRFTVGVVAVIQNDRGELLLLRHTYRGQYPWGLPTGMLERGEQPYAAIRREISEEAGFDVQLIAIQEVYVDTRRRALTIVYTGSLRGGAFAPNPEVSAAKFFQLDHLPSLVEDQRRIIEDVMRKEPGDQTVNGIRP